MVSSPAEAFSAGEESGNPVEFAEVCMCVRWRCAVLTAHGADRAPATGSHRAIRRMFPAQASGGQGEESLEDLAGARL